MCIRDRVSTQSTWGSSSKKNKQQDKVCHTLKMRLASFESIIESMIFSRLSLTSNLFGRKKSAAAPSSPDDHPHQQHRHHHHQTKKPKKHMQNLNRIKTDSSPTKVENPTLSTSLPHPAISPVHTPDHSEVISYSQIHHYGRSSVPASNTSTMKFSYNKPLDLSRSILSQELTSPRKSAESTPAHEGLLKLKSLHDEIGSVETEFEKSRDTLKKLRGMLSECQDYIKKKKEHINLRHSFSTPETSLNRSNGNEEQLEVIAENHQH
eukprot:TRINITY_DN10456_c0_g1_i1.p1 TRINITY_DN10456_c0_g1~~TRINITY_DN10456_c0_g1_i1.p1  ORF type:complete len:285 (+),score=50.95 TRINITY_DN10456_c0_g1_i1:61-855(+)